MAFFIFSPFGRFIFVCQNRLSQSFCVQVCGVGFYSFMGPQFLSNNWRLFSTIPFINDKYGSSRTCRFRSDCRKKRFLSYVFWVFPFAALQTIFWWDQLNESLNERNKFSFCKFAYNTNNKPIALHIKKKPFNHLQSKFEFIFFFPSKKMVMGLSALVIGIMTI